MASGYTHQPCQIRTDDAEIVVAALLKYGHTIACHAPPLSGNQTHLHEKAEVSGYLDDLIPKLFCGEIPTCQYFGGDVAEQNYATRKLLQETLRFLAGNHVGAASNLSHKVSDA